MRLPRELYARSAKANLKLARDHCVFGEGRQMINEWLRCDEILFNTYQTFLAIQDRGHAAQVKYMLLDSKNGFQHTVAAKRVATP